MPFLLDKARTVLHKVGSESSPKSKEKFLNWRRKRGQFHWVGRLSDIDLCGYYQHCNALLFPSVAEGFGLHHLSQWPRFFCGRFTRPQRVSPIEWLLPHEDIDAWVKAIVNLGSNKAQDAQQTALKRAHQFSIEAFESLKNAWNQL